MPVTVVTEGILTSSATYSSLTFTPVFDGQAFASAPFTQMFSVLRTRLNALNTGAPAQGAFTYEHLSPGRGDHSSGYLLGTGDYYYEKTDLEVPGIWVHRADMYNIVTEAGTALDHWFCGAKGPVGKTSKPFLLSGTGNTRLHISKQPELINKKSRRYCGGVLVLFDGIFRKLAEYETGKNARRNSFYIILYVLASFDGAAAEWYPIPVTERYIEGAPHGSSSGSDGGPIWRSGRNFSFRHLLTSKSIPLNHSSTTADTTPTSCIIEALAVGVAIVRSHGSGVTGGTLGVYIDSWRLSYLSMSGTRNRIILAPDSHGYIE